ncbi:MAG: tyrosine protein phosphatase yvh1 [Chaenotheca gracillima]|nr:MAG: tyrosine protein phosphatase yvh1 [Chaenotheca gracillima]
MVSWGTIASISFSIAPILVPRVLAQYRKIRSSFKNPQGTGPIPLSRPSSRALNILFISSVVSLVLSLPYFAPENIYTLTSSRLQTPSDVLFRRLSQLRPNATLTPTDETLRSHLVSVEARLLYMTYGPDPLTNCGFCSSNDPDSYLYFSLPSMLAPHIFHALALGLATSLPIVGIPASKWRSTSTLVAALLPIIDFAVLFNHNHKDNAAATSAAQLDFFHWRLSNYRHLCITIADLVLALVVYLSATNRGFVSPLSMAERTEAVTKRVEATNHKLHALGVLKNAVTRDDKLRAAHSSYWDNEGKVMGEVFEDTEVLEGVRGAVGRVDINTITADAAKYADGFFGGIHVIRDAATPT